MTGFLMRTLDREYPQTKIPEYAKPSNWWAESDSFLFCAHLARSICNA